jgi:hypothetical protein
VRLKKKASSSESSTSSRNGVLLSIAIDFHSGAQVVSS